MCVVMAVRGSGRRLAKVPAAEFPAERRRQGAPAGATGCTAGDPTGDFGEGCEHFQRVGRPDPL